MSIFNQAKINIRERKVQNERLARENREKALANEEYKKAHLLYAEEMISCAKEGKQSDKLARLQNNLDSILKKLNIGSTTPVYNCPKCEDTGVVDGKNCQCLKDEINRLLVKESGFKNLKTFSEANFSIFDNPALMQKYYDVLKKWCHSDFKKDIIYLAGGTGSGKTFVMQCMASELIALQKLVLLTSAYSFNQDMLKAHSCRDATAKQALTDKYLDCEVLFIDDLGTEDKVMGVSDNYLYAILNERRVRALPTVITSNLDMDNLQEHYDRRIASRIADEKTIKILFPEKDVRIEK